MIWCKHTWYAHLRSIETDLTMIQNKTQSGMEAQPFGPTGTMSQYVRVIYCMYVLVLFGLLSLCIRLRCLVFPEPKNLHDTYWGHRPCVRFTRRDHDVPMPGCSFPLRWVPWMVLEKRWERMKLMRGYGRSSLRNTLWIMESLGPGWYFFWLANAWYSRWVGIRVFQICMWWR